ncbi:MAG TPA: metallophosphoesterase [Candidatus Glassbacteria bacterium]|nr:metallophosphoesterase [Candidatus Glassbacteria bacterium]
MLVGIVSDSHDNVPMLRRAVEHFSAAGCELVLHAGDVIAPFAMAVMDGLSCPFKAIYGNNDGEKVGLKLKAVAVGGSIQEPPLVVEAGGRKILVLHDCTDWQAEAERYAAEVVIFGHTHEVVVEKDKNGSRVGINPGECGGWLTGSHTAALLDTGTLEVRIIDLSLDPGKEIPE